MAGGGVKGLLSVIGHSKIAMLALTAAAVYGAVTLYDYASGAKAAREALKQLNETAEDWKSNAADTFYSASKGLESFGLTAEDFTKGIKSTRSWMSSLRSECLHSGEHKQGRSDTENPSDQQSDTRTGKLL